MDKLTPEQRRRNMQANKASDTSIERLLGRRLWALGLRYRKNVGKLPGKPDFVFARKKLVVFCDGDFWHGKDWEVRKFDHKSNKEFWINKIERNMERDKEVNLLLEQAGWRVLRFWETDIKKYTDRCAEQILRCYEAQK